jgi:hypothetical protein
MAGHRDVLPLLTIAYTPIRAASVAIAARAVRKKLPVLTSRLNIIGFDRSDDAFANGFDSHGDVSVLGAADRSAKNMYCDDDVGVLARREFQSAWLSLLVSVNTFRPFVPFRGFVVCFRSWHRQAYVDGMVALNPPTPRRCIMIVQQRRVRPLWAVKPLSVPRRKKIP